MTDTRLTLRGLDRDDAKALAKSLLAQAKSDDLPSLAAGVAFRIFLSLFPALFAAVAAFGLVADGRDIVRLLDAAEFIPGQLQQLIQTRLILFVEQPGGGATVTIVAGILGGLWAASSAAVMLARALTRIYGSAETRGFVAQRLTGLVIALAMFIALVILVVLLVAGGALQRYILDTLALTVEAESIGSVVMTVGRLLLATLTLVVLFAFVFWVGPDREARPRFQWLTPGAVIGVVGWIALSSLFGLYTRLVGENEIYGALGGVIVFLLWLQLSMVILFVGAELNALLRQFAAARFIRGEHIGSDGGSGQHADGEKARDGRHVGTAHGHEVTADE